MLKIIVILFFLACSESGSKITEPTSPPAPTVSNFSLSIQEDTSIDFSFIGSDSQNATITYSFIDLPKNGTVILLGASLGRFTPNSNFNGQDSFTYRGSSSNGVSNIATVLIVVEAVDDSPTTQNSSAVTDEDNSVTFTLPAEEYDGQSIVFQIRSQPSNGQVSISGSSATYSPNENWNGTDTFTYEAVDSSNRSILNVATATVIVNPVNDAPIAYDVRSSISESLFLTPLLTGKTIKNSDIPVINSTSSMNKSISIPLNAIDVDGDDLVYTLISTNNGSATLEGNSITYTPTSDWNGVDIVTYTASDGQLDSNVAKVIISVNPVNDAPTVQDFTITGFEDQPLSFSLKGFDADGDNLQYVISPPSHGSVTLNNEIVNFTPDDNWNGSDQITYYANDGEFQSNTGTIDIIIQQINDAPIAYDMTVSLGQTGTSNKSFYSFDAEDVDNDQLIFSVVQNAQYGTINIIGNDFEYYPSIDHVGEDSFQFKANDGELDSNLATVSITVNNQLYVEDIYYSIDEDNDMTLTLNATSPNFSEVITFSVYSQPQFGTATINGSLLYYQPKQDFHGEDSFDYIATGSENTNSNIGRIKISINPIEDVPIVAPDSLEIYYTREDFFPDTLFIPLPQMDGDGDRISYTFYDANGCCLTPNQDALYMLAGQNKNPGNYEQILIPEDSKGNSVDPVEMNFILYGGPTALFSISEWTAGWKENNEKRDPAVSYVPWASLGTTGYLIENRAGGVNLGGYERDFDRFDYWSVDSYASIEYDFSQPSLAWNYTSNTVEGYVPFTIYAHITETGEKYPLYAAFLDSDGNDSFDIATDSNGDPVWQGPVYGAPGWDPVYAYHPFDTTGDGVVDYYNTNNDAQYITENNAFASGGCGWGAWSPDANPDHYSQELGCPGAYAKFGANIEYPFMTATMFTDYLGYGVLPDAAGIATGAYNAGNWTGASSIVFETGVTYYDTPEGLSFEGKQSIQSFDEDMVLKLPSTKPLIFDFTTFDSDTPIGVVEP